MIDKRKVVIRVFAFIVVLVVLCISVCYTTFSIIAHNKNNPKSDEPHQWLHDQLELTQSEEEKIHAFEKKYQSRKYELEKEFKDKIAQLSKLLQSNDKYTPEVTAKVSEIHAIHGNLQQLAIKHYYDMFEVLTPEKREKLKQFAVQALSKPQ